MHCEGVALAVRRGLLRCEGVCPAAHSGSPTATSAAAITAVAVQHPVPTVADLFLALSVAQLIAARGR